MSNTRKFTYTQQVRGPLFFELLPCSAQTFILNQHHRQQTHIVVSQFSTDKDIYNDDNDKISHIYIFMRTATFRALLAASFYSIFISFFVFSFVSLLHARYLISYVVHLFSRPSIFVLWLPFFRSSQITCLRMPHSLLVGKV